MSEYIQRAGNRNRKSPLIRGNPKSPDNTASKNNNNTAVRKTAAEIPDGDVFAGPFYLNGVMGFRLRRWRDLGEGLTPTEEVFTLSPKDLEPIYERLGTALGQRDRVIFRSQRGTR